MATARTRLPELDPFELLASLARVASEDLLLRPMLQRITDALHRQLVIERVAIVTLDTEQSRYQYEALSTSLPTTVYVGYNEPLLTGSVEHSASRGATVRLSATATDDSAPTLPGAQSGLAVPIRFAGQTVAVLRLESTRRQAFDGLQSLMESVAAQLAGTIAAAQRMALLDRRSTLLESMVRMVREALEAPDLESLCNRLLLMLGERMPLAEATILLESDLKDHLQVVAHQGASPHITYRGKLWPVQAGVVGRCFRTGETQWVQAADQDHDYATVNPRVQAELAVPIRFRERVFGVLNLETESAASLDHAERLAIRALADQAGGALHLGLTNQRLQDTIQRLQNQHSQLEHTRESLKRAVGKLKRRQHHDPMSGLPNREQLLDWLHREANALRRGGRSSGLLLLRWPDSARLDVHATSALLEQRFRSSRGQLALLDPCTLVLVVRAADRTALEHAFQQDWGSVASLIGLPNAALLVVDAPARVHAEAWLAAADLLPALPPVVRSFAAA